MKTSTLLALVAVAFVALRARAANATQAPTMLASREVLDPVSASNGVPSWSMTQTGAAKFFH